MANDETGTIERLLRRARDEPGAVPIEPIVAALDGASEADRERAASALYEISKSNPDRLVDAVSRLVAALDSDRVTVRSKVLLTTSKVGAVRPEVLAPHADALTGALADDSGTVQRSAARALEQLAAANPTAAKSAVPALLEMLESDSEPSRRRAIDVLRSIVAEESSGSVVPVEPLLDVLERRHEATSDLEYDPALSTGTTTANEQVRGLRMLAESDAERSELVRLREGAVELLAIQAANDPTTMADRLAPHRERVAALLDDRDPTIRGAIVGVLAYVAEHDPSFVRPVEARLVDLLEEPIAVAGNALWALRFVESERAIEAIRTVADDEDTDAELRSIARRVVADLADL